MIRHLEQQICSIVLGRVSSTLAFLTLFSSDLNLSSGSRCQSLCADLLICGENTESLNPQTAKYSDKPHNIHNLLLEVKHDKIELLM